MRSLILSQWRDVLGSLTTSPLNQYVAWCHCHSSWRTRGVHGPKFRGPARPVPECIGR